MPVLWMTKGLPGSGKTTWAEARLKTHESRYLNVNRDDLRRMMHGGRFSRGNEKQVKRVQDSIIREGLQSGRHVIVSDTNLHPSHEVLLRQTAEQEGANFEIEDRFLLVPLEECIKRDLHRRYSVGERVIRSMYIKFLKPEPVVYTPPENGVPAIIFDIDGTLAHMHDRDPYEWDKVGNDIVDEEVKLLTHMASREGIKVILLSGRDGESRSSTKHWLRYNDIPFDALLMREEKDMRPDDVVKKEIFDDHIKDFFDIKFLVDDRNKVVDMWRSLGLKVFQVADYWECNF